LEIKRINLKKDAILFYREILNSYNFGESLTYNNFNDLIDLLLYEQKTYNEIEDNEDLNFEESIGISDDRENELEIIDIKVSKVQFNTNVLKYFGMTQLANIFLI
jgi:hypothetical protein